MTCPKGSLFIFIFFQDFESGIVNLVAADPLDACYSVNNGPALHRSIALVERG